MIERMDSSGNFPSILGVNANVQRARNSIKAHNYATHKFTTSRNKSRRVSYRRPFAVHKLRINELPMFADRNGGILEMTLAAVTAAWAVAPL